MSATRILGVVATCVLAGCASKRVVEPAKSIASAVGAFQADLSAFQQSTRDLRSGEDALASGNDTMRKFAAQGLRQLQTEQAIVEASGFDDVLKILQSEADARIAALVAPANAAPTPASAGLPIGKLSEVTKTVQQIAKPPRTRDDLKFLAEFAKTTNDDLAALTKDKK